MIKTKAYINMRESTKTDFVLSPMFENLITIVVCLSHRFDSASTAQINICWYYTIYIYNV